MTKLKSTKLWITIWQLQMITYIVIQDKVAFYGIAQLLSQVPLAFIGANVWQKNIFAKEDKELER